MIISEPLAAQARYFESLESRAKVSSDALGIAEANASNTSGKKLASESAAAAGDYLSEVKATCKKAEGERDKASSALVSLEALAASEVGAMREQLATTRDAVVRLEGVLRARILVHIIVAVIVDSIANIRQTWADVSIIVVTVSLRLRVAVEVIIRALRIRRRIAPALRFTRVFLVPAQRSGVQDID